jgi:hypothetical protein
LNNGFFILLFIDCQSPLKYISNGIGFKFVIYITKFSAAFNHVCLLEFVECVRDGGNRDADHFGNISNGEFFMPAEKIVNLQAGGSPTMLNSRAQAAIEFLSLSSFLSLSVSRLESIFK